MSLEARNIHISYAGAPLLSGATLTVPAGQSVFVLGPSGCGKTTLLRIIAGLEQAESGSVMLNEMDLNDVAPHQRRIGMLSQEPALFPHLTVAQNVAFGLRYRGISRRDEGSESAKYLALVELTHKANSGVENLSGGERQRVALARTLAARPRAVLLDEPLTALDAPLRMALGQRIRTMLQEQGIPALWVTHDEEEATRLGDQILRVVDGKLVSTSS